MRTFLAQSQNNTPINGVPAGTIAIYDSGVDGADHSAAINPGGNLSKVGFHSSFDYLGIISEHTNTVVIPATSAASGLVTGTSTLFSHGQGSKPLIMMQYSPDNSTWYSVNGTTYLAIASGLLHLSIHVQADATNVYLRWSSLGDRSAATVYLRTQVIGRTFQGTKPSSSVIFDATSSRVKMGSGILNTENKYIQSPAVGQSYQALHTSGHTLQFFDGNDQGEKHIAIASSALHGNVCAQPANVSLDGQSIIYQPPASPLISRTRTSLVFQGPSIVTPGLEINSDRIRLARSDGVVTLDTSRSILTLLDEFQGTFSISSHGSQAWPTEVPHLTVLASKSVNSSATMIFGWLEITAQSVGYVVTNTPLEFSSTVMLWSAGHAWSGAGQYSNLWAHQALAISPRIVGGSLQVIEQYWNDNTTSVNEATPSVSGRFHLFTAAMLGGF